MESVTPIPHTLEECFVDLDKMLSEEDKVAIRSLPDKNSTWKLHYSLGQTIRNRWQLWDNEPLLGYFASRNGFLLVHPDDVSGEIIDEYYDYLCRKQMEMELDYDRLREMIARCTWTFAKTMPQCPHEYIVRNKCPLSDEEFLYFVDMQRRYGIPERWGPYNHPYLHIDGHKYWTMGDTYENTVIINRAKE